MSADTAPYPVVVIDADGQVVDANEAAGVLLPASRPGEPLSSPDWLADASSAGRAAAGAVGGRFFSAHPSALAGGETAWWLVEETDYQRAIQELDAERGRTRFLTEASTALLSSLNLDRCMEVTARLAAEYLADAVLVIAPTAVSNLPVAVCDHRGEFSRITVAEAPDAVPGLAEALRGLPPVPSRWIDPASAPDWVVPEGFGEVGSMAITPLPGHGVPGGALILLRRAEENAFTEAEETLAGLFAARAGAAMSAARLYAE
ncbi:hypothetical protein ACGFOM_28280 [Streptomyces sp. NPDC048594]|uniref:hypothetical protein n=1 Tax=Streptomyces sp. NPDC048594 TaxID=3365575 RepID=UPI00371E7DE8